MRHKIIFFGPPTPKIPKCSIGPDFGAPGGPNDGFLLDYPTVVPNPDRGIRLIVIHQLKKKCIKGSK